MNRNFILGTDLGGTKILTALSDLTGKIIATKKIPTQAQKGKDKVISNILESMKSLLKQECLTFEDCCQIGIAVPGPVNHKEKLVYDCPNLKDWKNVPIGKIFKQLTEIDTVILNDARAAGLGESQKGAGKNVENMFYLTISTGIGGAIIENNKLFLGKSGAAGEFGQTRLISGEIFEHIASGTAIKKIFGLSTEEIPQKLKYNDKTAIKAINHLVYNLGIWLGNITTLLNPELIVIGGGVSNLGDILLKPLETQIKKNAFSISSETVKIEKAKLGELSGIIGIIEFAKLQINNL